MSITPFKQENQAFSDLAHEAAKALIYPTIFSYYPSVKIESLTYTSTTLAMGAKERLLDGEMGVDRIVSVHAIPFLAPFEFTIQERFRDPKWAHKRDITITEWNHLSNSKSELYKIKSGLFVYGYFDQVRGIFVDWIAVETATLLHRLVTGQLLFERKHNPRSNQTFVVLTFDSLRKNGCVVCEMPKQRKASAS